VLLFLLGRIGGRRTMVILLYDLLESGRCDLVSGWCGCWRKVREVGST